MGKLRFLSGVVKQSEKNNPAMPWAGKKSRAKSDRKAA